MVLNSLGTLLLDRGETGAAKPTLDEAVAIRQGLLPPEDPGLVWFLNRIGEWYECVGAYDDAEPILRAALEVRHLATEVESSYLVRTLCSLARLEVERGRPADAGRLFEEALTARSIALGNEHPEVGQIMVSLGFVTAARGQGDSARRLIEQGLALERRVLEADPDLLDRHHISPSPGLWGRATPRQRRVATRIKSTELCTSNGSFA